MLFMNVKSGNLISATDEEAIQLMLRSPIYEQVKPEKKKPARKTSKKKD